MNNEIKVIATTAIITTQLSTANAAATQIAVKDLNKMHISPSMVTNAFWNNLNVILNPNESIWVTYENEGKEIKFETLDHHSINIPAPFAIASPNKGDAAG